jgi:hypothetical protein
VFRHPLLTPGEIHGAYERVNREFFSVKEIARRWWKFMRCQAKTESLTAFLFRLAVCTAIYFELSVFQRHHARVRVLAKERRGARRPAPAMPGRVGAEAGPAPEGAPVIS